MNTGRDLSNNTDSLYSLPLRDVDSNKAASNEVKAALARETYSDELINSELKEVEEVVNKDITPFSSRKGR